jgi:hypothetical protein
MRQHAFDIVSYLDTDGSFTCNSVDGRPRLSIAEYSSDLSRIQYFHNLLPIGNFHPDRIINNPGFTGIEHKQKRSLWGISSKEDLKLVVKLIDQYHLQSDKQVKRYEVWRQMVESYCAGKYGNQVLLLILA